MIIWKHVPVQLVYKAIETKEIGKQSRMGQGLGEVSQILLFKRFLIDIIDFEGHWRSQKD